MKIFARFKGKSPWRIKDNHLEKLFIQQWQEEHTRLGAGCGILPHLLDPEHQHTPTDPSERDWKVAATIIQWLGSPCGEYFVRNVLEKSDAIQRNNH